MADRILHLIVIARSFSDEATQGPWVAAPPMAARDDVIDDILMGLVSVASGALNFPPRGSE